VKVGDIVKFDPRIRWLTKEEHDANGIILTVLDGGSHRKNTSYQVMWSSEMDHGGLSPLFDVNGSGTIGWYVAPDLMKVETCL